MKKHIVFTVINDLSFDQRMQRICTSLANAGYEVTLIGRTMSNSVPLKKQAFKQIRFNLWFSKGKLFYLEYNTRLLCYLLFKNFDIYSATDLDTLLPHFIAAKAKKKPHVYDAHEYFAELPEIVDRPITKFIWKSLERFIVPRTKYAYTINQSYADLFRAAYKTPFGIIRNATVLRPLPSTSSPAIMQQMPELQEQYILYQGAVNVGRGIEEMIQAMPMIDCKLYICGDGDVMEDCKNLVKQLNLESKVVFFGRINPEQLIHFTRNATMGFTFFTRKGISYRLSLANRFFDYFHNGIPQLAVDFREYRLINEQQEIALLLDELSSEKIAVAANRLLGEEDLYQRLKANCLVAREVINWQEEEKKLLAFYEGVLQKGKYGLLNFLHLLSESWIDMDCTDCSDFFCVSSKKKCILLN